MLLPNLQYGEEKSSLPLTRGGHRRRLRKDEWIAYGPSVDLPTKP
jgi:hypothetical protein